MPERRRRESSATVSAAFYAVGGQDGPLVGFVVDRGASAAPASAERFSKGSPTMHGVQGAEKLMELFGHWPSFHDAEVISLVLDRSGDGNGFGPSLVATIRAFDITNEVLPSGFLKLSHECATVIAFREVVELQLTDFNDQNVLSGLHIIDIRDRQLERQHFEVTFAGSFGLDARFQCRVVEVLSVAPL